MAEKGLMDSLPKTTSQMQPAARNRHGRKGSMAEKGLMEINIDVTYLN